MNFQLDEFFKSPYLFEVGVYFRHMHLWRDPHVRESPGSLTPSVFLRHPVKPYKNNQNFQSVESSFTVFFLRKKPRRKKKSSHQDPGISPTHRSVQKQWSEITLRFLSPEGDLLRSEESEEKTELGSIHEFPFSQNTSYPSHI